MAMKDSAWSYRPSDDVGMIQLQKRIDLQGVWEINEASHGFGVISW
jgi:hypothetical protein